jgi:hypothetical protein
MTAVRCSGFMHSHLLSGQTMNLLVRLMQPAAGVTTIVAGVSSASYRGLPLE